MCDGYSTQSCLRVCNTGVVSLFSVFVVGFVVFVVFCFYISSFKDWMQLYFEISPFKFIFLPSYQVLCLICYPFEKL